MIQNSANNENKEILTKYQDYIIRIKINNKKINFLINELGLLEESILSENFNRKNLYYYGNEYSLEEIIKVSKEFKSCDNLEEVLDIFQDIFQNKKIHILKKEGLKEKLTLFIKLSSPGGKEHEIEINMKQIIFSNNEELIKFLLAKIKTLVLENNKLKEIISNNEIPKKISNLNNFSKNGFININNIISKNTSSNINNYNFDCYSPSSNLNNFTKKSNEIKHKLIKNTSDGLLSNSIFLSSNDKNIQSCFSPKINENSRNFSLFSKNSLIPQRKVNHSNILYIKDSNGKIVIISYKTKMTIGKAIEIYCKKENYPILGKQFIYKGKSLDPDKTFEDYGISSETTLLITDFIPTKNITIRTLSGDFMTFETSYYDTIENLKNKIFKIKGCPEERQVLLLNGKIIQDDLLMSNFFGNEEDNIIYLLVRPLGK